MERKELAMNLTSDIRATTEHWADWLEERLSELPGWDDMSERERAFVVGYACTGEKQEALRFISRHPTWCYDRRFRSQAFLDLVTDENGGQDNYIAETRVRMFMEASTMWALRSVLTLGAVLDAEPSRKTGITLSTKLRAAQVILRMNGYLR